MASQFRALLVFAVVILGGCAVPQTLSPQETEQLAARATARWQLLERRDLSGAYDYMSPAFREVFTRGMYERRFSYMVEWELTSVEVVNYDARAAVASVAVRVMSRPVKQTSAASKAIGAVPSRFVEQWILQDDEWWYSATL